MVLIEPAGAVAPCCIDHSLRSWAASSVVECVIECPALCPSRNVLGVFYKGATTVQKLPVAESSSAVFVTFLLLTMKFLRLGISAIESV